jgi:hypothetical protein
MSWRAVGAIYLVFAGLLAFVLTVERPPAVAPPPPEAAPERSLLGVDESAVRAIAFQRGDMQVRAVRDDGRWRVVEPSRAAVPPDLIEAEVATLTAGQVSEVVADGAAPDLAAFGLTRPRSAIVLTIDGGGAPRDVTVLLGDRNPTHTALYARRSGDPRVYLVGLNVRYYEELIFEAAGAAAS